MFLLNEYIKIKKKLTEDHKNKSVTGGNGTLKLGFT